MVRTQIYLPTAHRVALRREAHEAGISLTALVRRIVADHVEGRRGVTDFDKEAILSFVAIGRSGRRNTSERHDDALNEALRGNALR